MRHKFFRLVCIFSLIATLFNVGVRAIYDIEIIDSVIENGADVFKIEVEEDQNFIIYPNTCSSIYSVTIQAKEALKGQIIISPTSKPDNITTIENIYDICKVRLEDIDSSDIKIINVDLRIQKAWLQRNGIDKSKIRLFTLDESTSKWVEESTNTNAENSTYQYYESSASNVSIWITGTPKAQDSINWLNIFAIACGVLLLLALIAIVINRRRQQSSDQ